MYSNCTFIKTHVQRGHEGITGYLKGALQIPSDAQEGDLTLALCCLWVHSVPMLTYYGRPA